MPRGKRRVFEPAFKAKVVLELLSGAASQAELCRKHSLNSQLLSTWKTAVLQRLPSLFQEEGTTCQDQLRIAELEQLVGRHAYDLEILKKASRMLPGLPSSNGRLS